MGDKKANLQSGKGEQQEKAREATPSERMNWETPKMEDVSEQVMAQPYIRFT